MNVRQVNDHSSVIDIAGELTGASESALTDAHAAASGPATRLLVLNFSDLEYMNSTGIGLLVTMLIRAQRQGQRVVAYGLDEHYREIFSLTRLDEAIGIVGSEEEALAACREIGDRSNASLGGSGVGARPLSHQRVPDRL